LSAIEPISGDSIRGFLHRPAHSVGFGLVLTHGAGANCQSPLLVAVAGAFSEVGWWVLRCDLPFRQQRRFGPPHMASAAQDREGLRKAVDELRARSNTRVCLGGHSYGGRQASMLLAEDAGIADGLLLFSYPLHPPKKPEQLRTGHFSQIRKPALFVHGSDDPFGSIEEVKSALALIPGATQLVVIETAGHDLKKGAFSITKLVVEPFQRMLA
jgi:predicted alpha/beta-hydrolase family hydrolase